MKKRKRSSKNKPLTQEEIWDDSALIESWEEAAEEYKLYHSIQAKGQNVEDVLREAEAEAEAEAANVDAMLVETVTAMEAIVDSKDTALPEDFNTEEPADGIEDTEPHPIDPNQETLPYTTAHTNQPSTTAAESSGASMPQMVLGGAPNMPNIQDEGLKNLMMSWYFAGYYTGLYEGQQRAGTKQ